MRCRAVAALALLALVAGCGDDGARSATTPCTLIGALHGVSVTVAEDVAPINGLVIRVCTDQCSHQRVTLERFGGTQDGFVEADLPAGPVEVSGRYVVDGRAVNLAPVTVQATTSYPNGRDCGADGTQALVTITPDGITPG